MRYKCNSTENYEVIGLCNMTTFNEKIKQFHDRSWASFSLKDTIVIPSDKPHIGRIRQILLNTKSITYKVISTPNSNGVNIEGLSLSGKILMVNGILCLGIIYVPNTNQPDQVLKAKIPFSIHIVVENDVTEEDKFLIYVCVEDISAKILNECSISQRTSLFIFAHRDKTIIPPLPPIEKLLGSFVFYSMDNKEMAKIEFDKENKKIVATSTGISFGSQSRMAFIVELYDHTGENLKIGEVLTGSNNADKLILSFNEKPYEFGDIINLSFDHRDNIVLNDYPSEGEIYNMVSWSKQSFLITNSEINLNILKESIGLFDVSFSNLIVLIQFDKKNMTILVGSTGIKANPIGGINYFVMTLYQGGGGLTVEATSRIRGNNPATSFKNDFNDVGFAFGDILKLEYEEPHQIQIVNYPNLGEVHIPTINTEWFEITENGFISYSP